MWPLVPGSSMQFRTHNGIDIPSFMYGTAWKKEATADLVRLAVTAGFRAIDTANQIVHYDEARVGDAVLALAEQGIARDEMFLQTKFTPVGGQDHRLPYDPRADVTAQVAQSFASSLEHLHTDYVDSYVLHGPYSRIGLTDNDWAVWEAFEALYLSGKAKMIGVSNMSAEQLALLCEKAAVKPMVVQNRCYAIHGWDKDVREVCRTHGIVYQGFSLLTANTHIAGDATLNHIARRERTGPAQVMFRFAMAAGILPLTGTTNLQRMTDNLRVADVTLSAREVQHIETIAV